MATPKLIIQKANAFQLNPKHTYIIHIPGATDFESEELKQWLADRGIANAAIVTLETLNIAEAPEIPNVAQ